MDGRGRCQNQDFQEKQQFVKWIQFQHGTIYFSIFPSSFHPKPGRCGFPTALDRRKKCEI